jgi:hypothetical protein
MHDTIDPLTYKASMRNAELRTAINFPFHSPGIAQIPNKFGPQIKTSNEAENIKLLIMLSHPVPLSGPNVFLSTIFSNTFSPRNK